jgi:hypothetical protein
MRIVLEWISNKKDTKIFTLYPNYPVSKIIIKHWSLLFRENKTSFSQISLEDMRSKPLQVVKFIKKQGESIHIAKVNTRVAGAASYGQSEGPWILD